MMDWYHNLERREQIMALVGSFAVLATLLFLLVIEPLEKRNKQASINYKAAVSLNQAMQETTKKVAALRKQLASQKPAIAADKLLGLVDQTMKTAGIAKDLKSIAPEKNNAVKLRFEDVNFDAFIAWLINFHNRYGIKVDTLSVMQTSTAGRVKASLLIN